MDPPYFLLFLIVISLVKAFKVFSSFLQVRVWTFLTMENRDLEVRKIRFLISQSNLHNEEQHGSFIWLSAGLG